MAEPIVDERLVQLLYPEGAPSLLKDPEYETYLAQLTSYNLERLSKEPDVLIEQAKRVKQQMQDLAYKNYRSFIQTHECIRSVHQELASIDTGLDHLQQLVPSLINECHQFCTNAQQILGRRTTNRLTLQHHTQILELLEIPQLMDTCVRNQYYEEALQLCSYAQKLNKLHPDIKIIQQIAVDVKVSTEVLISQLYLQLRTNIQLPQCLKIIGLLRRLEDYTDELQLRINFLRSRDAWLQSLVDNIPGSTPYGYLSKLIDLNRTHMFDIITQYRAIFSDEEGGAILYSWITQKITGFLSTLDSYLPQITEGSSLGLLLDQCMYFGMSLGRVDVDFRASIFHMFSSSIASATHKFIENLKAHRWVPISAAAPPPLPPGQRVDPHAPPTSLLEFPFLALLTNAFLSAFNELRQCTPLALMNQLSRRMEEALVVAVSSVKSLKIDGHVIKTPAEDVLFSRMCKLMAEEMLPYLANTFAAVFHANRSIVDLSCVEALSELYEKDKLSTSGVSPSLSRLNGSLSHSSDHPTIANAPATPAAVTASLSATVAPVIPSHPPTSGNGSTLAHSDGAIEPKPHQ